MTTTSDFLSSLYPQGIPDGACLELRIDTGASVARAWCQTLPDVIPTAKPYVKDAASIWFGPGLRRARAGSDADIGWLPALWVDCDAKCFPNKSRAEALCALTAFDLQPSIVVDTGHGMQAYWLLDGYAEGEDIGKARASMQWIKQQLSEGLPKPLDSVHNPSRVMRLPNTWNRKDASNPLPCRIILLEANHRYNLLDFDTVNSDPLQPTALFPSSAFSATTTSLRDIVSKAVASGIEGWVVNAVYRPDLYHHGDNSALDWKVIVELVNHLTLGEVEEVWVKSTWGNRAKVQQRQDYRRATIWKAHLYSEQKKMQYVDK